jgi:riboflavin transporter FmnP
LVKATGRPWTVWPAAVVVAIGLTILGVGVGFNMNFVAAAAFIGLISARKKRVRSVRMAAGADGA